MLPHTDLTCLKSRLSDQVVQTNRQCTCVSDGTAQCHPHLVYYFVRGNAFLEGLLVSHGVMLLNLERKLSCRAAGRLESVGPR